MPAITNMCNKLVSRLEMIPFIVLVYDLEFPQRVYQLNHLDNIPERDNSFTIILDQSDQTNSLLYPDTYVCQSVTELEEIINFIYSNKECYLENINNNEYDNLLEHFDNIILINSITE